LLYGWKQGTFFTRITASLKIAADVVGNQIFGINLITSSLFKRFLAEMINGLCIGQRELIE